MERSDIECIDNVLSGDVNDFRYLINRYQNMVFSIAISLLKDQYQSEEVTQDTFIKAYKSLSKFKGRSKFSTWLYRIAYNESIKRIKSGKKIIVDNEDNYPDVPEDNSSLKIELEQQKWIINKALDSLPPDQAVALRLFYLEEESMEGVRKVTKWSESKVKVTLHRARKNFYDVFKKYERV